MATAENVAAWFHGPASSHASAHYVVDVDSAVQLVAEDRTAWAAGHTGNQLGIHIELSGYAKQTWDDWAADEDMISRAADLVADILQRHGLPCEWVDVEGLRARQPGVTTHAALSQAFHESDHWDPGSGFDMEKFLELVYQRMPGAAG
jgi:N-acetyl-anhydromuramyl-L-alanine amidase AmpD